MMLYNSMGRRKQRFRPIDGRNVGMYTCGITVYYSAHIGNLRSYVNQDILKRVLLRNGYSVRHVQNITDVGHLTSDADSGDDKLRLEAEKERKSMREIADFYTGIYLDDLKLLNVLMPDVMPRASDHIPDMLKLVKELGDKGFLYQASNGIYFDTSRFKGYGKLTGMSFKQLNSRLKEGARVEKVEGKRHLTDFAVWRFASPEMREMVWDSPWGRGFPGWHLECSAMSMKYLGNHFDVHCGGIDHLMIHHPNEIAQSEGATGERLANYWVHCEFLVVDGKKMSKSAKNIYTVKDILAKGHNPMALRLFLMSANYRQTLNFTFEALKGSENELSGIYSFMERLSSVHSTALNEDTAAFKRQLGAIKRRFFARLNDDVSMPEALSAMHSLMNVAGARLGSGRMSRGEARAAAKAMLEMDSVLGLNLGRHYAIGGAALSAEESALLDERATARAKGDFSRADEIRKVLMEKYGIIVEDTKEGQIFRRK
ncbi:MAG: cysteine--tRNA ligase [Candidatus Marsarchaeota archaeon]|jgi:cysteinyl-tRNA synthetase|nr:cysteine--tRNA ligase [Candidatus Marsarchaeota archaeon]MCL5111770.1 cysteine--tRNA ligase [Candidatus Marsarchaeota archaeon]